ncbi:aminoacyl-histidine dipeptidase [Aminipila butyrica]|uniref:Cytosol non-specific dipeptidase n=1 Tax=Aminipila butyrica TaxID=433296 RepID=A0A858BW86_9FIRM|nr:aminoacyl-histidine dipeptidase [Aminipila butyrica]QIB69335.1 aminoacyl-histidine dipeptidase [Aminipila butyrica]
MEDRVLENQEPIDVFFYFEELSKIPRGSGNEQAVSDYLVSFAKAHGLDVLQDAALNVLIKKPGSPGYENRPGVVIQGHMDMVCEKAPGVLHDFLNDPIGLQVRDDMLYATGTTLGADNGIAVAMGLALLAAEDIPHPPLELLVTTCEETGMDGAHALDPKTISGRTLINIDSEEEGILTVSCAGGCSARISLPVSWEKPDMEMAFLTLTVEGLKGGHSGIEIHKGRANANKLLARVLNHLSTEINFVLCSIDGGSKHNAIARDARSVIGIRKEDDALLRKQLKELEIVLQDEFKTVDPDLCIRLTPPENQPKHVFIAASAHQIIQFLYLIPNGVQTMSMDIEGLVESSLNLGVIQTKQDSVEIISAIRSSVGSIKANIFHTIVSLANLTNGQVIEESSYPEWRYNPESKIRTVFADTYEKMFGKKPVMDAIHAGLECALFDEMFAGQMDMISIGPTMVGVHTAEEHLSIPSTKRTWEFLKEVLKAMN